MRSGLHTQALEPRLSLAPRSRNSSEEGFAERGRNAEGCGRKEGGQSGQVLE